MGNDQAIEQEIQAKGLTAPRVKPEDITANIVDTEFVTHVSKGGKVLRWAILTTQSGHAVVGKPSVSVSPANDDEQIGRQVAYDNSRDELWPLMGYALAERLSNMATPAPIPAPASTLPPHQQRVVDERNELAEKGSKLAAFLGSPTYCALPDAEQDRMAKQLEIMDMYCAILSQRIAAFPVL